MKTNPIRYAIQFPIVWLWQIKKIQIEAKGGASCLHHIFFYFLCILKKLALRGVLALQFFYPFYTIDYIEHAGIVMVMITVVIIVMS